MKRLLILLILFTPLFARPQLSGDVAHHYTEYLAFCEQNSQSSMNRDAYALFKKVLNSATEDELLYIEQSGNATTNEYIVKELVDRKSAHLLTLFTKYIHGENTDLICNGIRTYHWNLAIEMYESVAYQKQKLERRSYYEQTTKKALLTDVKQLFGPEYDTKWTIIEVEALLKNFELVAMEHDDVSPELLNYIFRYRNYKIGDVYRVRFFATKHPTAETLATLATFKNPQDVPFLQQNMNVAFLAVARYPHPAFLPELRKRIDSEFQNKDFQAAVTSFCNADSKVILDTICRKIAASTLDRAVKDEKLFALYSIMERQNYTFYRSTLSKIDTLLN